MSRTSRAQTKNGETKRGESRLPIPSPAEAYYLAQVMDSREVATRLVGLLPTDGPETDAHRHIRREIERLHTRSGAAWDSFLLQACSNPAERSALDAMGFPDQVEISSDDGMPVAVWNDLADGAAGMWNNGLTIAVASGATTFTPTVPFREVRTASLPEGTALIRITDHRHAATAAIENVLTAMSVDIDTHVRHCAPNIAWRRLAHLVAFYNKAVRLTAKSLGEDEYRDWERRAPKSVQIEVMAQAVVAGAWTARAQQIVALQLVAQLLANTMSECERADLDGGEEAWVPATIEAMDRSIRVIADMMRGYNIVLMACNGKKFPNFEPMTIARPMPRGLPLLAVIPKSDAVTTLSR